jgi:prepilin-type processing-associated H-X9-DG protein
MFSKNSQSFWRLWRASLILIACLAALALPLIAGDSAAGLEYKVKAGYLFNFSRFVDWPESAFVNKGAPFVFAIAGTDPFSRLLDDALAGKEINGHPVVIRRLGTGANFRDCHIVFVSRSEKARVTEILSNVQGLPILTVGEIDRFCQAGGMVNFNLVDGHVKLDTNPGAVLAAGLKISSKLLSASKTVNTETGPLPQ